MAWTVMERRRAARLRRWAEAAGWEYHEDDPPSSWRDELARGRPEFRASRWVRGPVGGAPVTAAQCRYTARFGPDLPGVVSSGGGPRPLCAYAIALPRPLPRMRVDLVRPAPRRPGFDRLRGAQQTPFADADFDRMYRITAPDLEAARRLFTPDLVQAHLRSPIPSWRVTDTELVLTLESRLNPKRILNESERLRSLAGLLG